MGNIDNLPLVSCTVLCYNSVKTVIETLESIKAQTYRNIELIVSDDCSKDDTVELCRQWINQNKECFVRTELLTVEKNTGVCANGNRALAACQGEWKKDIAADDILLPNCIEDFVKYVNEHHGVHWVSSYVRTYRESFVEPNCLERRKVVNMDFFSKDVEGQLIMMARSNCLYAPSLFIRVSMIKALGGYDNSFPAEDYPFSIKALENGYKCYFLPVETIGYRTHQSLSRSNVSLFNYSFSKNMRGFIKAKCFAYLTKKEITGIKMRWAVEDLIQKVGLNRNNRTMKFIYSKVCNIISHIF